MTITVNKLYNFILILFVLILLLLLFIGNWVLRNTWWQNKAVSSSLRETKGNDALQRPKTRVRWQQENPLCPYKTAYWERIIEWAGGGGEVQEAVDYIT